MKSLVNLKIIMMIIATGILFSCKNNQDGYNDEIKTNINPSDSVETPSDTATGVRSGGPGANESSTTTPNNNPQGSSGTSTSGKGSGPGESPKDGATYTNYSKAKNDSPSTDEQNTNQKKTKNADSQK
jgi:hypothetical protein